MFKSKLFEIVTENSFLYHGSGIALNIGEYLKPNPSNILNGESMVFATDDYSLAMFFVRQWSKNDFYLGYNKNDNLTMTETYPNQFNKMFQGQSGYIYVVSKKDFSRDKRLGMYDHEFISRNSVKILDRVFIQDTLSFLKDKIIVIPFQKQIMDENGNAPMFITMTSPNTKVDATIDTGIDTKVSEIKDFVMKFRKMKSIQKLKT